MRQNAASAEASHEMFVAELACVCVGGRDDAADGCARRERKSVGAEVDACELPAQEALREAEACLAELVHVCALGAFDADARARHLAGHCGRRNRAARQARAITWARRSERQRARAVERDRPRRAEESLGWLGRSARADWSSRWRRVFVALLLVARSKSERSVIDIT